MNQLKEIWAYREMIRGLVHRDLRGRYKGSVLGFLWTFINPFLQLLVYTLVFSIIMRAGIEKYYLYLFVALIPWMFFANSVSGGSQCILSQSSMVTKIYFPREVLPIAHVLSGFINMLYCFIVVFIVVFFSGIKISLLGILTLPLIMMCEFLLSLGLCFIVSAISVYLRDLVHIMGIIVMAWQYLTPVMYPIDLVPQKLQSLFNLNPMTQITIAYRDILYYGRVPKLKYLIFSFIFSIVVLFIGYNIFGKLKRNFAEQL